MTRVVQVVCAALAASLSVGAVSQTRSRSGNEAAVELSLHQGSGPLVITSIRVDGREVETEKFRISPGE
jgi:hypothetical protein